MVDKKKESNSKNKINIKELEEKAKELEKKADKVIEENNRLLFFL